LQPKLRGASRLKRSVKREKLKSQGVISEGERIVRQAPTLSDSIKLFVHNVNGHSRNVELDYWTSAMISGKIDFMCLVDTRRETANGVYHHRSLKIMSLELV